MSTTPRDTRVVEDDFDRRGVLFQTDIIRSTPARFFLTFGRILMGWTFLWPFIDKLFGLGYATPSDGAWINGGTPAQGFMKNAAAGPFADFFGKLADTFGPLNDWVFMIGLLGIGIAMLLGAGLKIAAWSGTLLLFLMYLAQFPIGQANEGFVNPITDSHWIEAVLLLILAYTLSGDTGGLGRWWGRKVGNSWLR